MAGVFQTNMFQNNVFQIYEVLTREKINDVSALCVRIELDSLVAE